VLLPKRWIVERSYGGQPILPWARDYERLPEALAGLCSKGHNTL
jgi:hypothetical protein